MKSNPMKPFAPMLLGMASCIIPLHALAQNNLMQSVDCAASRPPFEFTIAPPTWTSADYVNPNMTPLVGDIDGDGKPEVLAMNYAKTMIYVFDGATGATIGSINIGSVLQTEYPTCFLIVDGDKNGKAEVFIAGTTTQKIYLYEVDSAPGVRPITFTKRWEQPFVMGVSCSGVTPVVADLDGDGIPEFVAGNKVIDYDGNMLATLPFSSILGFDISMSYVADVDGDGLPEIITGSDVYKYASGVLTLYARCPEFPAGKDGWNMSADMNLDGDIDLVFNSGQGVGVVIWTPKTNTVIDRVNTVAANSSSCPFIGDIDGIEVGGKKYPEFCIIRANMLYAFKFNGTSYSTKWILTHNDGSGVTMLTLFDFNLDGVVELIYRDESTLRVFDGSGSSPAVLFSTPCYSGTTTELPIVADVTGDGSANIIVTGWPAGGNTNVGQVFVYEGDLSKWASCPGVWNQQLYSPLWVNLDLTIPETIQSQHLDFHQTCGGGVQMTYYNGGPMQAPFISAQTYCPFDFSSDVFVVSGSRVISGTSITISITFGNQGMANASGSIPIQFYKDAIAPGNVIGSTTLGADVGGADLLPGNTRTITRTFTVNPMSLEFYVRVLDDGSNFPALGAFSDCDLTNNTKSFGALELTKEVTQLSGCLGGTSTFSVKLTNDATSALSNIAVTDSLGMGWDFVAASSSAGTSLNTYNPSTRSVIWTIPSLPPDSTVELIVTVTSATDGKLENFAWISSVNGMPVAQDIRSAYVLVSDTPLPSAPSISPSGTVELCPPATGVMLAASGSGVSFQWYKDGVAILGETADTYFAAEAGSYTATLFDGTCTSEMSDATVVTTGDCLLAVEDYAQTISGVPVTIDVLANDELGDCPSLVPSILSPPANGSAAVSGNQIIFTPNAGFTGQTVFEYMIACNGSTSQNQVYVTVLPAPNIVLQDSCSTQPKLQISIQYVGATYGWYYSAADDGITWDLITGEETVTLLITEGGFYKAKISYNGMTLETLPVDLVIDKKVLLPGNVWWYQIRKL